MPKIEDEILARFFQELETIEGFSKDRVDDLCALFKPGKTMKRSAGAWRGPGAATSRAAAPTIDAIPASLQRVRRSAIPAWFRQGARSCGRYSQRNATLGSTPAARRAGR